MVARVGLLSADSFVNCKFGSQGPGDRGGGAAFLRPSMGRSCPMCGGWPGVQHIWTLPTLCLGEELDEIVKIAILICAAFVATLRMSEPNTW